MLTSRRDLRGVAAALLCAWVAITSPAAQTAPGRLSKIVGSARFQEANAFIRTDHERFVRS